MSDTKRPTDHAEHPHHCEHPDHSIHHGAPGQAQCSTQAEHPDHDDIGCLEAIEAFYAYLDGELDDPESIAQFEHHMAHCRSCYSRTQMERMLNERMKASGRSTAPDALRDRLRNLMKKF